MSKEINTTKAVFTHVVHHNEMLAGAQLGASINTTVSTTQHLASAKGLEGAHRSLLERYKNIRNNR
jgi:hypothetical protein